MNNFMSPCVCDLDIDEDFEEEVIEETPMISESKENAEKEEERRLDAELDKCTEMFHDYLKSKSSTEAMDDIEKAIDRFCGKSGTRRFQVTLQTAH